MSALDRLLAEAKLARDSAKWSLGVALYSKANVLMPDAWQIAHNRGLCFLGAGQFREAIADAQKASDLLAIQKLHISPHTIAR